MNVEVFAEQVEKKRQAVEDFVNQSENMIKGQ